MSYKVSNNIWKNIYSFLWTCKSTARLDRWADNALPANSRDHYLSLFFNWYSSLNIPTVYAIKSLFRVIIDNEQWDSKFVGKPKKFRDFMKLLYGVNYTFMFKLVFWVLFLIDEVLFYTDPQHSTMVKHSMYKISISRNYCVQYGWCFILRKLYLITITNHIFIITKKFDL